MNKEYLYELDNIIQYIDRDCYYSENTIKDLIDEVKLLYSKCINLSERDEYKFRNTLYKLYNYK